MKQISAIIERAEDGTYSVYQETALKEGFKYPDFLDEDYDIDYAIDARSLLNYYVKTGMFSLATLEKVTGINQEQLWAYTRGTKPRKTQSDKFRDGFIRLAKDMDVVFVY